MRARFKSATTTDESHHVAQEQATDSARQDAPRGVPQAAWHHQVELAARMKVPVQRVNTIIDGKRGITAETAILLSEALNTSPERWMGLQASYDLWHALRKRGTNRGGPRGARGVGKHQAA